MYRQTYARVDLDAVTANAKCVLAEYPAKTPIAVVKANAYGHGFKVVPALEKAGISYFAVATPEEALALREVTDASVLLLEPTVPAFDAIAAEKNVTLTVDTEESALRLAGAAFPRPIRVHLKVNSGMNRLGFRDPAALARSVQRLSENASIEIEGIFTHFGTGGIYDPFYDAAVSNFRRICRDIDLNAFKLVHFDRSFTLVHHPLLPEATAYRPGIILFGFSQTLPEPRGLRKIKRALFLKRTGISSAVFENALKLRPALSLHSAVIAVQTAEKGECVGYGTAFCAPEKMRLATLGIGFADGVPKGLKRVSIGGALCPVFGEICMDMTIVAVPDTVKIGDVAEIFGNTLSTGRVASECGLNAYRLLCGVSARVPRVYTGESAEGTSHE